MLINDAGMFAVGVGEVSVLGHAKMVIPSTDKSNLETILKNVYKCEIFEQKKLKCNGLFSGSILTFLLPEFNKLIVPK